MEKKRALLKKIPVHMHTSHVLYYSKREIRARMTPLTHDVTKRGGAVMDVRSTHDADEARIRESFNSIEEVDLELIVNRYGFGAG